MYSDSFIEQVKSRTDIVDVIAQYISVSKKGRNYWACCPFHHEKTPSFQIKQDQQVYRCYGCGKHGNMFTFLMEQDGMTFVEALETLAKRAGLALPEQTYNPEEIKRKKLLEKIYDINRETALFYYHNLQKQEAEIALEYLAGRGIKRETIQKFAMGYSYDFDSLPKYLSQKGYDLSSMKEAGVIGITESGKPYDFYGQRLIIPIVSSMGKVIGFTGRLLEKKPDFAKYKNTFGTLAFNKKMVLFGLNLYKKYRQDTPRKMILVEGHMDVISLYQEGIQNAVASMGTSLTIEQCKEIKRNADIVYVSYDGDSAGQNATLRGLDLLKQVGMEVFVVELTDNLDPDDYVRKYGRDGYEKLLENALPLVDFKLKTLEKTFPLTSYDNKVKYAKEAIRVLSDLDSVERSVYMQVVAQKTGLSEEVLESNLQNLPPEPAPQHPEQTEEKSGTNNAVYLAAVYVLSCMYFGKPFVAVEDVNADFFPEESHKKIIAYILTCAKEKCFPKADKLYELTENKEAAKINDAIEDVKPSNQEEYYKQCLRNLKIEYKNKEIKRILDELKNVTDEEEKKRMKEKLAALTKMKL